MAKQRYYLDTRVFTAFFLAAMPFVAFGSFLVVSVAKNQLRESVGVGLEQRALQTKLALEQHLSERISYLRIVALDPQVQKTLASPSAAATATQAVQAEQGWALGTDPKLVAAVLESPLAPRLRSLSSIQPMIHQLQVVDLHGRVVAASSRGGRLFHGESAWFTKLAAQEGEPQAHLGDVERPRGSTSSLLEIAYPVRAPDEQWLGAVRALVDANDMYAVLAPVRVGRSGHAVLVRSTDGIVLAADESERILKLVFPGFESLRSALEGFPIAEPGQALFGRSGIKRGYWTLPEARAKGEDGRMIVIEPARLVGFSPVDQLPDVKWLVAVEQDLSEALAPIETVTAYLWIHFIGVFLTVILLAVYFSFKLERPVMEKDLHLHEQHLPAGMKEAEEP
jgi:hypothetical protein